MTTSTRVEVLAPQRPLDDLVTDESLPADLTVQVGSERAPIADSVPLQDFVASAGNLSHAQRMTIVQQALILFEGNYVHLPLKAAMHAVNPVQRLRLLRARLEHQTDATMEPERDVHHELSSIFLSVRDLHTNYLLPAPFKGMIAYLPFQVERCVDGGGNKYIISHMAQGVSNPPFTPGVEITHWKGVPIALAVAVSGDRFAGSNQAARLAHGLDALTLRPLVLYLPPDEEWVTITYLDADGVRHELRQPWLVGPNVSPLADADALTTAAASVGLDLFADEVGRARALLFAPQTVEQQLSDVQAEVETEPAEAGTELTTTMPMVFRARSVVTSSGTSATCASAPSTCTSRTPLSTSSCG